ncbi:MAG: hypothetical protein ACLS63_06365 [Flavonifractor plautii]
MGVHRGAASEPLLSLSQRTGMGGARHRDLYGKLRYLTDKGLYGDYILAHYTHEEIAMAEDFLCPERDELFTYSGLDLLLKRYVIQSRSRVPLETPQEMFWVSRCILL